MTASPYFSVIIPAWNAASTLRETLDSIAAQTDDAPKEVVVVDDGSTDETAAIAETHPLRPRVISKENGGAPSAVNAGIKATRGEILTFLDSDDLWVPEKLDLQRRALEAEPRVDAVLGHTSVFRSPEYPHEAFASMRYKEGTYPGYLLSPLAVRRSTIEYHGLFFDEALRTGYFIDWFRRFQEAGLAFRMLDATLHRRRIRPGTLARRETGQKQASGLSRDFLEIARRAMMAKREKEK